MKQIELSIFPLMVTIACLMFVSCSSETESITEGTTAETVDEATELEEVTTSPLITVTINNMTKNTVVYSRADDDEIQTEDEKAVESIEFYFFMEGDDNTYYYYSHPDFTVSENKTSYSYSIGNDINLIGETIQVLLVANDAVDLSEVKKNETTLDEFKKSLATASVSSGDNVDVLVGGFPSSDETTGFPMSATACDYNDNKEIYINDEDGEDLEATLIRTMARVDIKNYATNLTVTDVWVANTPNKSFLFAQDALAEPTTSDDSSFEYVTLKALSAYYDDLEAFTTDNDYVTIDTSSTSDSSTSDSSTSDGDGITIMEQVLYMYEQSKSETSPATIYISFEIDDSDYSGTVEVTFDEINVNRNYLYTIRLGKDDDDDSEDLTTISFDAKVAFSISVNDWELGTEIGESLDPEND